MKDRIKKIRKDQDLTQVAFGEKIGVKGNTITSYETGLRTPTNAVILSICQIFDVSEEWLRYGKGEPYIEKTKDIEIAEMLADVMHDGEDNFKHKLISALARLNDNDWNSLEKFIDLIKK